MGYLNLGVALSHNGSSFDAMHAFHMSRIERTQRPDYVAPISYDETEMTLLAHEVRTVRTVCDWHLDRNHLSKLYHEVMSDMRRLRDGDGDSSVMNLVVAPALTRIHN